MGVQSSQGQVMFSSIALLQQRFRELERIRAKREERLLHVLAPRLAAAAAAAAATSPREMPVKWFFHPELLYPCRPLRDTTASSKTYNYKHVSGEVDVDTSLHL